MIFGNWVQQNKLGGRRLGEPPLPGLTEMCHPVPPLKSSSLFSEAEIKQIIGTFRNDRYYAHYTG